MTARTALITGASRGIGAEIARRMAAEGWSLTLTARDAEALKAMAGELDPDGRGTVTTCTACLSDEDAVRATAHAHLDALVLSAGMGQAGPLADFPLRRLGRQYTVNLREPYALIQECLPTLRATARRAERREDSDQVICGHALGKPYGGSRTWLP